MAKYAVVKEGKVVNTIEWDGITNWSPPQGTILIRSDIGDIDDDYDENDESFIKKDGKKHHKDKKKENYKAGK